jgi:Flp pilus assembly protein TadG
MQNLQTEARNKREKGAVLLLGILSMLFILPMMGLAIDVGFIYSVKARLQSAVDGAALAAARGLSVGATTASQKSSAQANAVLWFYSNFPNGYFGTTGTVMTTSNVNVFDDPNNPHLQNVTVSATTLVDTFFMKWLNFPATLVGSTGNASRRDTVIMMIMDRSSSMNSNNGCSNMRAAAKLFTGQFAEGRDRLGMVEFSDTSFVDTTPVTNFQSVLGYTYGGTSGNGLIDTITCNGNTNTSLGLVFGYNELYKTNLPGAYNVLMFFTDGIPNSITVNLKAQMLSTSGCQDSTGTALSAGGNMVTHPRSWTPSWSGGTGGFWGTVGPGPIGTVRSDDPTSSGTYGVNLWAGVSQSNPNEGVISATAAPGCAFPPDSTKWVQDYQSLPPTDVFGNNTVDNSYNPIATNASGNIVLNSTADTGTQLTGNNLIFHYAARNAANSAAYNARSNATIPATIFGVGLGGTSQAPPGYDFMQRITNDPNGDLFNNPALYSPCAQVSTCAHWSTQPQGVFIYSSSPTQLQQVFLEMASQILRLSK